MNLRFQVKNYRCFSDEYPARFELRKGIHAFVGPNNSGKSSILKLFYDFRNLFRGLQDISTQFYPLTSNNPSGLQYPESVGDVNELFFDGNSRDIEIVIDIDYSEEERSQFSPLPNRVIYTIPRGTYTYRLQVFANGARVSGPLAMVDNRYVAKSNSTNEQPNERLMDWGALVEVSKFLTETMYIGPFRNAISIEATELGSARSYFDIQTGSAFIAMWKHFKSGAGKLLSEKSRKLEMQLARIFGYQDLQVNAFANERDLQLIVDDKSYKSTDMGAGILQFVIVLASAAIKSPRFILIDEPELNLHPLLQTDFLTTLAAYATEGVLFATHSVGLARATAETIYSTRRTAELKRSEVKAFEATSNLTELLGELGFNAYRDLGFSKVLLVEGPSDVKAIQQFLRHLGKEHQILLLPLGGAGMINGDIDVQLQEIKRIGADVSALIDSERIAVDAELEQNRKDFQQKCAENAIKCCILDHRAIENYLTDRAIKKVKGPQYSALMPYQKLKDIQLQWAKAENWLIAREMDRDEFENTDLGHFLVSL
jgi:predicted ATPase